MLTEVPFIKIGAIGKYQTRKYVCNPIIITINGTNATTIYRDIKELDG